MRTSMKTLAAGSLAAASLLIAPAAIAADSTATVAVASGNVAVTASPSVPLTGVTAAHTAQDASGTVTVGVDDTTGTGDGWSVTQKVSDFTYTDGGNAGATIGAANFSVTSVGAVTHESGVDDETTVTAGGAGALDTARPVLSAAAEGGEGSYTAPVTVNLTIPADSRAGTYQATITTTAAPAL
jgi:hypothetical protein